MSIADKRPKVSNSPPSLFSRSIAVEKHQLAHTAEINLKYPGSFLTKIPETRKSKLQPLFAAPQIE